MKTPSTTNPRIPLSAEQMKEVKTLCRIFGFPKPTEERARRFFAAFHDYAVNRYQPADFAFATETEVL